MNDIAKILQLLAGNTDITPCLTNCSNNGRCVLDLSGNYSCLCFENYTGVKCEKDIRPCSSSPCINNGECLENQTLTNAYTYTCKCTPDFHGAYCQLEYDLCANVSSCKNGQCYKKGMNETACRCFYLYEGENCDQPSVKMKKIKTVVSVSAIIAIITLFCFYSIFILNDLVNICLPERYRKRKKKNKKSKKSRSQIKMRN